LVFTNGLNLKDLSNEKVMNIFILSLIPELAAVMHCDKHVVKMILEYAQLLSTAHHVLDGDDVPSGIYKKAFQNHPCGVWTRASSANYMYLYRLFWAVCEQYTIRYNKVHATARLLEPLSRPPANIPEGPRTPFAQAMPDERKVEGNAVQAYRQYYIHEKAYMARWKCPSFATRDGKPHWMII
jgi:hypothetical protein